MQLIIAEKPSLARNIADAIGNMQRRNGYMEGSDYIITWVFGHLFSLADIEHYSPAPAGTRGWTFENLPCFPKKFEYQLRPDKGVAEQFRTIARLANRPDVTAIINAGDADREGEIIVRTCVHRALESEKPVLRLWLPDQTAQTVRAALADIQPDAKYDALANEGYARTYIDWLWGVNLTRYATILTGKLLRVGRVIVPIVKAIYDRDKSIREFVPRKYWGVSSRTEVRGEEVVLNSREEFDGEKLEEAQALCDAYNALTAVVTDKKSKEDFLPPGKLYSLSTLQNVLGKKFKMSMKDSLDIVQSLYERGYLTYPRTNSEYLATAEKGKVRQILDGVARLGYPVSFRDSKYIFDDSKIESHSALTPTYKIPAKGELNERETQVYSTVFRRFVAVFCSEPCRIERSELRIMLGDREEFVLKGTAIVEAGWTKYDDYNKKDKFLPALEVGEVVPTAFAPQEKETTPPKHYTIETLNNYLKNPFKEERAAAEENESDEEDYRAIFEGLELGTEATRTGIIDNARKSNYIALNKDSYVILPDGEFLIESLTEMGIVMDKYKTSEMGQALKRVYRGTMTVEESTRLAEEEITEVFSHKEEMLAGQGDTGSVGDVIGKCPLCGGTIVRGDKAYACDNESCTFRVGLHICRRAVTPAEVTQILEQGHTEVLDGFISKNNRRFSSALMLKEGKVVFDMEESHEGETLRGVKCPVCGKKMVYSRFGYACSVKKCGFSMGRTILKRKMTEEELAAFCERGITPLLEGFVSKNNGTQFSAYLALQEGTAKLIPANAGAPEPNHDVPCSTAPRRTKSEKSRSGAPKKTRAKGATSATEEIPAPTLCPLCGERVVRGRANWGCMGYTKGCTLRIPFVIDGYTLTDGDARALVTTGHTAPLPLAGGAARLVLRDGVAVRETV